MNPKIILERTDSQNFLQGRNDYVHPFPARMAPEIAFSALKAIPRHGLIVDPMCGSGVVIRTASEASYHSVGVDIDPLAVLMTKVWTTPLNHTILVDLAHKAVTEAQHVRPDTIELPWIDTDKETQAFIQYWYGPRQTEELRRLASILLRESNDYDNALKLALSRLIVTKAGGASLANDTSHSRPHKVREINDFDLFKEFQRSAARIANRLQSNRINAKSNVFQHDVRKLPLDNECASAIITSPPYLNAIDYFRGHRLSLVWLGYNLSSIRQLRSASIGAEVAPATEQIESSIKTLYDQIPEFDLLSPKLQRMIGRYSLDVTELLREVARLLREDGRAVLVVGNSTLNGVFISNADIIVQKARNAGLELKGRIERSLPAHHRYLPAPTRKAGPALSKRMKTEAVLTFFKA